MNQTATPGLGNTQAALGALSSIFVAALVTVGLAAALPLAEPDALVLSLSLFPVIWAGLLWRLFGAASATSMWLQQAAAVALSVAAIGLTVALG